MRDDATRRRRTCVVVNEVGDVALADIVANVVRRDDGHTIALVYRDSRAIGARAITVTGECIDPGSQVSVVVFREEAAFLYVQKNDFARREVFYFRCCGSLCSVSSSSAASLSKSLQFVA